MFKIKAKNFPSTGQYDKHKQNRVTVTDILVIHIDITMFQFFYQ